MQFTDWLADRLVNPYPTGEVSEWILQFHPALYWSYDWFSMLGLKAIQVNSSPPSAAYMRRSTGTTLVQIMACRLVGAEPLSEPMLEYCQLDLYEQTSVKFYLIFGLFFFEEIHLKMSSAKWRPFCPGRDELIIKGAPGAQQEIFDTSVSMYQKATGLDAWASRVKCPARFVSHLHDICIYIWIVYSFCLFCCLFIIVTTQFVALYKPCKPKPKPSTYDPPDNHPLAEIQRPILRPVSDGILTPIENWPAGHFSIIEYWPAPWKIDPSSVI